MDMNLLNQILGIAFEKRVSDLHFEVDNPPFFRAHGQLIRSKLPSLTPQDTEFIARVVLEQSNRTLPDDLRELDAAYLSGTGASDELLSNSHYLPARYLQTVVGKDDGVEVFGAHPLIAFLLKKKLPSRFAMVQHLMFCPPGSGLSLMQRQGIEEYTRAVMSARPRFFVIAEQGIYFGTCLSRPSLKQGLAELFPELSTFLERNYMPLKKISQTEIFELKPGIEQGRPGNGAKP